MQGEKWMNRNELACKYCSGIDVMIVHERKPDDEIVYKDQSMSGKLVLRRIGHKAEDMSY